MRKSEWLNIWKVLCGVWIWWLPTALYALIPTDSLSLVFVGDLMQHKAQIEAARKSDGSFDYSACFMYVKDEIRRADIAIGNLEVPLGGPPYTGYPAFSAPDEWLYAVKDAGFDVLLTANNHCLDRGRRGMERTLLMLDSLNISSAGTYRDEVDRNNRYPLLVEKNGFKVVLLNYTYGTNGIRVATPNVVNFIEREQIRTDIMKARQLEPDVIIACMHWGIEYRRLPEKAERELAEWMLKLGVDHVVGTHPHVIQPIEVKEAFYKPDKSVIAYSLGNFVSNMSQVHTDGGMVLKLVLERKLGQVRLCDCGYSFVWTSRPVLNKKSDFTIYPSSVSDKVLNNSEKYKMGNFLESERELQEKYSSGIFEYFF